ncbi:MAG: AAA family ATPase [Gammaproteobacteria bacterium]|nr:AAA family ATPase [Gammaproteobacteria bacterium]
MICTHCDCDNPAGARFCAGCGAALVPACPTCGAEGPPGAKYCVQCGACLAEPAAPAGGANILHSGAERRQLTVMFCDLAGSTELATRFDPEELRELNRLYRELCETVIRRFDGYIARYMGDGVLAYFGYPRAHEDDPERAVRAALELTARAPDLDWNPGSRVPVQVRVGIATGPVVVGELIGEGAAQEHDVVGETPNLAARLQALAGGNEVVASDETRKLIGGVFAVEDLGEHSLKGFPVPHRAWRVAGARVHETRFDAAASPSLTPFVGRDHEIALVRDAFGRAARGDGQVVLLCGEPGIGKSRIMQAIREELGSGAAVTIRCQCSPYHTGSPLHPVVEHLKRAARLDDDGTGSRLDRLEQIVDPEHRLGSLRLALFANLVSLPSGERYPNVPAEPDVLRERTTGSDTRLARGHRHAPTPARHVRGRALGGPHHDGANRRPRRAYRPVDCDAHDHLPPRVQSALGRRSPRLAADPETARPPPVPQHRHRAGRRPLAARGTASADHGTHRRGAAVRRGTDADHHRLGPSRRARRSVRTRGLAGADGHPGHAQGFPDGAARSTGRRQVPGPVGAVIGREFPEALLTAVSGLSREAVRAAMERLGASQLVFPRGSGLRTVYVFKHALVRDAAYSSLLKSRRRALHGRIAEVLCEQFGDIAGSQPELIARHFDAAGRHQDALEYFTRAARQSAARSAYREAIVHFERALAIAESEGDEAAIAAQTASLRVSLAECLRVVERIDEALEVLVKAQETASRFDLDEILAKVHYQRGNCHFPLGRTDECLGEHRLSIEFARRAGSVADEVRALGGLGDAYYASGRMRTAKESFDRCVDLARCNGMTDTVAANLSMVGFSRMYLLEIIEAINDGANAIAAARSTGHQRAEMLGCLTEALANYFNGEYARAIECVSRADALADDLGAGRFMPQNAYYRSMALLGLGRRDEARRLLDEAEPSARRYGRHFSLSRLLSGIALVTDDGELRRRALAEGEQLLDQGALAHNHFAFCLDATDSCFDHGEWEAMRHYADLLERYTRDEPLPLGDFVIARARALAAWGAGERGHAVRQELERLHGWGRETGFLSPLSRIEQALGKRPDNEPREPNGNALNLIGVPLRE